MPVLEKHQPIFGLWAPIGFSQRPQELAALRDNNLKVAAQQIDPSHYKTIVHGDAKLANFVFQKKVPGVDFQYVGGGWYEGLGVLCWQLFIRR